MQNHLKRQWNGNIYNLKNLIKGPTCFKNPDKPSCIDLILLTNKIRSFQGSHIIETGISDFHKMVITVMKIYFKKQEPKIITYMTVLLGKNTYGGPTRFNTRTSSF